MALTVLFPTPVGPMRLAEVHQRSDSKMRLSLPDTYGMTRSVGRPPCMISSPFFFCFCQRFDFRLLFLAFLDGISKSLKVVGAT
jgi:hypothetical protein